MTTTKNRREHERHKTNRKAVFVMLDPHCTGHHSIDAIVSDIGRGGACLQLQRMLHMGTNGVLMFTTPDGPIIRGAETRSVRFETGKGYITGVRFWSEAPDKALNDLLSRVKAMMNKQQVA